MKELPTHIVEGTEFVVDAQHLQLYEKARPVNKISLFDIRSAAEGYEFLYSPERKNLPTSIYDDVITVKIPEFTQLDPEGMAERYGLHADDVKGKTDFELMVNQEAYQSRKAGVLPTLEIEGHIFFVDIGLDALRPKDNLGSGGILISQIESYYDDEKGKYIIPYNPVKQELQEIKLDSITAIPRDVILVSFPHAYRLDPIGANRKHGVDDQFQLKERNVQSHFKAERIEWKDTVIGKIIKQNIKQQQKLRKESEGPKKIKRPLKGPRL